MAGKMGHKPVLVTSVTSTSKWEKCSVCETVRKRGDRWKRPCPGPKPEKRYMAG